MDPKFQFKSHFIHTERIIKKTIFSEMSQRLTVTNDTIGKLKKELLGKIINLKKNGVENVFKLIAVFNRY